MALSGVISGERLSAAAIRAATAGPKQAEILTAARTIYTKTKAAVRSAVFSAIFPGPAWLWIAAAALAVGFVIWAVIKPPSVPGCTDSKVTGTISSMMLRASIDERIANPLGSLNGSVPIPSVHGIKEVGLATEPRIRGCVATLKVGENEIPYAFTIARSEGEEGDFTVTGAEPAIVQARFGNLDANGAFLNKAEPIGRAEVERALRSGVESLAIGYPSSERRRERGNRLSTTAPEREREIAEIEPMGPCREIKQGTVYSCRLLIERNDALLSAIGAGSGTLIDSAFTFERDSATSPWHVSASFAEEYLHAATAARFKAIGRK
jgi:hypothetical protein